MTTFRILPSGHRRRLPNGSVRALGENGSPYFDISGSTSLGVDTGGAALPVVPIVGQTWLSFALAGSLTLSGTVGHTTLAIGIAGALSNAINMRGASLLGVNLLGNLTPSVRLYGSTGMQLVAAGRLLPSVPMRGLVELGVDAIGQLSVAAAMRGQAGLGIGVYGSLTAKAGQKWRDLWLDVYDTRQTLLNAIDANNRYLAKQAGDQATATANALVVTNTNVTNVDNKVTAVANRTTLLESKVNDPINGVSATATGLNSLRTTVTQQGNQISAQASDITSVRAAVGATSSNLIANTGFESDTFGWVIASDSLVGNVADSSYKLYRNRFGQRPGGINVLTWQSNTTLSSGTVIIRSNSVPAEAGTRYCVQCAGDRPASSTLSFGLDFLNSSGVVITGGPSVTATPGYVTESAFTVAPAGTVAMRFWLRSQVTGTISTPAFSVIRPMVSVAAAEQTTVPPWQPSASGVDEKYAQVTQQMAVEVDSLGAAKATWGLYLDVNGRIVGMQSINDGVVGQLNFMADVFRLMSPAGADGMEIQDGYIRVWKGNSQTIIGNNFGVAGQKLMRWFGPNIGAANCTKANATIWEDSDGNAYFGGQVLQGVLRFFDSTTSTSSSASIETGQNNSNGKPKAISVRYTFDAFQDYPNLTGQITPGSGVTSAVIAIERQYSGGSWTELGRRTMVGQVEYEKSDASFILWTISGSMTVTDADSSTASRSYRARIVSRSQKPFTVTNPGQTPAVVLSQYLSVESME